MTPVSAPASGATRDQAAVEPFAADVRAGLEGRPRRLPPRYLYDTLGSRVFEAICELPWYRITRAERQLLAAHGGALARLVRPGEIVELGCGDGDKLAALLTAMKLHEVRVHLVDISTAALEQARRTLDGLAPVWLTSHRATYEEGLAALPVLPGAAAPRLVLFLGSNIGNFDPAEAASLLARIRGRLRPTDRLLVGLDLVKPQAALQLAYDDPLQVTAAFNRNLLVRINRELGAALPLDAFAHRADWNAAASRVEMHLVATRDVHLVVPAAGVDQVMRAGETIWTESSYKFEIDRFAADVEASGFRVATMWEDPDARFALVLMEPGAADTD